MDILAGALSTNFPNKELARTVNEMSSGVLCSDRSGSTAVSWSNDLLAITALSDKGNIEHKVQNKPLTNDWGLIWPAADTLFYWSGYFSLGHRAIHGRSGQESIVEAAREVIFGLRSSKYKLCQELGGSFLILVYDTAEHILEVISDRLGSRHFFYYWGKGNFFFSSDVRGVLQNREVKRSLDLCSMGEYLRLAMILGDRTLYEEVKTIPPASILRIDREGLSISKYWAPRFDEKWCWPRKAYTSALTNTFKSVISRQVESPEETGLMLSGGLDSRMIAAAIWSTGKKIRALSFGGFENEEVKLARRVADKCGFSFTFVKRNPDYYLRIFESGTSISNGLYAFHHAHFLGLHQKVADLGISALLHGWGLDLLFSGSYLPKRMIRHLPERSFNLIWPQPLNSSDEVSQSLISKLVLPEDDLINRLPTKEFRDLFLDRPKRVIADLVDQSSDYADDLYNRHDWVILTNMTRLRSYLFPLSIRWGCKERCPLFDKEILDMYLHMPSQLRVCSRTYGAALEDLFKPLSTIPYSRIGTSVRSAELKQSLAFFLLPSKQALQMKVRQFRGQHKEHFAERFDSYPVLDVLLRESELRILAEEMFSQSVLDDLGLVNGKVLNKMLSKHLGGELNYGDHLMLLLTLEKWLRDWL